MGFLVTVICVLLLVIVPGCGDAPAGGEDMGSCSETRADTLYAADSIGVLMGDSNYVLGAIADFTTLPGGRPAILDRVKGTVSIYDGAGTFLYSFGGFGEGPGEFQYPFFMTCLESGIFVVTELMGNATAMDSTGSQLGRWKLPGFGGLPLDVMPFDDSTFVCYYFGMHMDVEPTIVYSLERYNAVTGELMATYFNWTGAPDPSTDFTPGYIVAAADGQGHLYMSRMRNSRWMVEVFGDGPEPIDSIMLFDERERIAVPDSGGFVPGCVPVQYAFSDGSGAMVQEAVNMPEEHPFISQLAVDGEGNIWCRRGGVPGNVWDVVSPGGEALREVVATLPDSAFYIDMDVNPHGILAYDMFTEDYHKLYMMEWAE